MISIHHLFVINPTAGHYDATPKIIAELEQIFGLNHDGCEIHVTKGPGESTGFLRKRLAELPGPVRVYACGGDGTLNEALNGVIGFPDVSLACYPSGTGNDFIKIFGPDAIPRFKDIRGLITAEDKRIDVMRCMTNDAYDGRYAINICSVGLDARVAQDVHRFSKITLFSGTSGYLLSLAYNFISGISSRYTLTLDGKTETGKYVLFAAANGRCYGGSFCAIPEAMPDDGICEFLVVPKATRLKLLTRIGKYKTGRHQEITDFVKWSRGESIRITAEKPFAANIDGETWMTDDVTFSIVRDGLAFAVPKGMSWRNQE